MARDELSADRARSDPGERVLCAWLDEVEASLVGPSRWRAGVLDELYDGLREASTQREHDGLGPLDAAEGAVSEFGDPRAVGAGLSREGAAVLAARVGAGVLASGPVAAAVWVTAFAALAVPLLRGHLAGVWWAMPTLAVVLAVVIPAAMLTRPPSGLRLPARLRSPLTCARTAAVGCAAADALMLGMVGVWVAEHGPEPGWGLAAAAVAFSTVRLIIAVRVARSCSRAVARLLAR